MASKVSSARRGVTIVHGGKPRPMSSAQLRFLRGRVMRYACADVLLERLEREGLISDDERKQLANDVAAACRLASGSIFRGVDYKGTKCRNDISSLCASRASAMQKSRDGWTSSARRSRRIAGVMAF